MLQQDKPNDLVIATGRQETVRRFIELVAKKLGWGENGSNGIIWEGKGLKEIGRREKAGKIVVRIDPRYFRPTDVDTLLGNPSRAHEFLGWKPTSSLEELVSEMVENDCEIASKESYLKKKGFKVFDSIEQNV